MDKIKITFDARMSEHSGIGTYIKNMVREISKDLQVELTVICKSKNNIDLKNVFKVHYCETDIYTVQEQFSLIKFFPEESPNTFFWSPHINIPLLYKSKNLIVTVHDLLFFEEDIFPQNLVKKIYRNLFFNRLSKKSKIIFTPSKFTKAELNKRYPSTTNKSFAIHLGVGEEWKKELNLPKKKEIVFIGNIKKNKNLGLLVHAFNKIKDQIPHNLVIIGASQNLRSKEDFNQFEIDTSRVIVEERLADQDLVKKVAQAELVVCPSLYEGFGLVPVEAYSLGTKVLCSDIAVHQEVVGEFVSLFKSGDISDCAKEVLNSLSKNEIFRKDLFYKKLDWKITANSSIKTVRGKF